MIASRRMIVGGVLIAAVAVAAPVVALTGQAPSDGGTAAALGQETREEPAPTPSETGMVPAELRLTTYEVFLARDPFTPILPDEPVGTVTPVVAGGETPTDSPTPTTSPDPTTTDACTQSVDVVCAGRTVSLVDVFSDDAGNGGVVQVDETAYEVRAGETFADSFRALSIEPPCLTLQYGDDTFTLCEGESVLK